MIKIGIIDTPKLHRHMSAGNDYNRVGTDRHKIKSLLTMLKPGWEFMYAMRGSHPPDYEGPLKGLDIDVPSVEAEDAITDVFGSPFNLSIETLFESGYFGFVMNLETSPVFRRDQVLQKRMFRKDKVMTLEEMLGIKPLPGYSTTIGINEESSNGNCVGLRVVTVAHNDISPMPYRWKRSGDLIQKFLQDAPKFEDTINRLCKLAGHEVPDSTILYVNGCPDIDHIIKTEVRESNARPILEITYDEEARRKEKEEFKKKEAAGEVQFQTEPEVKPKKKTAAPVKRTVKHSFSDVHGLEDAISELKTAIKYFRDPEEFRRRRGVGLAPGCILYGESGTGKTLLAKAFADEAGVKFVQYKAAEIWSSYQAKSEQSLDAWFEEAKSHGKCVIFIDEFDQLGRSRNMSRDSNLGTEGRLVNMMLTYLDGFDERGDVYVVAATNRIEDIDHALRHSKGGRLKEIEIPLPNYEARRAMLQAVVENHGAKVPVSPFGGLDYDAIAKHSKGLGGRLLVSTDQSIFRTLCDRFYERWDELGEEPEKLTTDDWLNELKKYGSKSGQIGFGTRE